MKMETIKILRKISRKDIPISSLKSKVIQPKKRKLIERITKREIQNDIYNYGV